MTKKNEKKNFREDSERPASSSGKSSSPPSLPPFSCSSAVSLHLTRQCFRIKMTTHFQKHTRGHTHTQGISLGSVRDRYRPYFITDFTHVSNHKTRVSHSSGQTQTSPLRPFASVCPPLCPEPNPFHRLLNRLPCTLHKLSGPHTTPQHTRAQPNSLHIE